LSNLVEPSTGIKNGFVLRLNSWPDFKICLQYMWQF